MEKYLDRIRNDEYKRVAELEAVLHKHIAELDELLSAYFARTKGERFIEGESPITRDAFSAYDKELRRIRLEEISVKSRKATVSADKKIDAEAEKNPKQLHEQAQALEDQAKWLQEQIEQHKPIRAIDVATMQDEVDSRKEIAKRLRNCLEEAGIECLLSSASWIIIRQKAE